MPLIEIGWLRLFAFAVSFYDTLYKRMPYDIFFGEMNKRDARDFTEHVAGIDEAATLRMRQVDLREIACDDHLGAHAQAGEEHLNLRHSGVLRLIEDNNGIGKRSAAHESQGRNLNNAFFHILLQFGLRNHILQRIIKRLQIGVDLLLHIPGQKA